ncbi:hypothetical protein MKW98_019065 [Papaver atlanticum]|uniref:Uncharacterized protein n=1 Tax=Papaver atlanticum TaxID=357466 RepID=A0AAD4XY12_9MAGN|nr:hypothetical protein MKW98_019065 [Papaver atlanticum]
MNLPRTNDDDVEFGLDNQDLCLYSLDLEDYSQFQWSIEALRTDPVEALRETKSWQTLRNWRAYCQRVKRVGKIEQESTRRRRRLVV